MILVPDYMIDVMDLYDRECLRKMFLDRAHLVMSKTLHMHCWSLRMHQSIKPDIHDHY